MKIAVAGTGYVGLSLAVLLAQHNNVCAIDICKEKVVMLNNRISPIKDKNIEEYLSNKILNLTFTIDAKTAYVGADIVIISTPTNYDSEKNYFDTSSVQNVIETLLSMNKNAAIFIKSTLPVGYTRYLREKYNYDLIFFSPEFLREGNALYDNLFPSRIVVGVPEKNDRYLSYAKTFAALLQEGAIKEDISTFFVGLNEAESIKLFANTYLALRVAYFNELDTYASIKGLIAKDIIEGICSDPRIGDF